MVLVMDVMMGMAVMVMMMTKACGDGDYVCDDHDSDGDD